MVGAVRQAGAAAAQADGLAVAYLMAVVNAGLACLVAFGVNLSDSQQVAVVALVNAVLVAATHLLKANGAGPSGGTAP